MVANSNNSVDYNAQEAKRIIKQVLTEGKSKPTLESIVRRVHKTVHNDAGNYYEDYGINTASIEKFMLGIKEFCGRYMSIIPVLDRDGKVAYLRLRKVPGNETAETVAEIMGEENLIPENTVYPADAKLLLVGEDQLVKSTSSSVFICGDELDRIIAIQEGVKMPVITGGEGANFQDEWFSKLKSMRHIYVYADNSDVDEFAQRLAKHIPTASIYGVLPTREDGTTISLTDYFIEDYGTADELFEKYAHFCCGAEPIEVSQFREMGVEDIANVLDSTIKCDFVSKVVTFLVMLLAYTESDQQNVMFNADSSTGKTYICQEVSKYFPKQDVRIYGKTTPTAFYYSPSLQEVDKETGQPFINLERRILIFTEQPDTQLQENLRPLLSHDDKRIPFAITNKSNGGKNVATEGYMLGFPSTFFCSANMRVDEQEQTRCLVLSPESSSEKIMASVNTSIVRNSNRNAYDTQIENDEGRKMLKERILYVKSLRIDTIDIDDSEYLRTRFLENRNSLLPKAQREISHFISLVKAMALVNAPFRMQDGRLVATNKDVDEAIKLWGPLSESMSHGVSPQALEFYRKYVLGAYYAKNNGTPDKAKGVTYDEIRAEFYRQTSTYPNMENIRKQYIPALKTAALISCDKDEDDRRQKIVMPLVLSDDSMEK